MHSFEITVKRRLGNHRPVVVEYSVPNEFLPTDRREGKLKLSEDDFLNLRDPYAYGTELGKRLFRDEIAAAFSNALANAAGEALHVLLFIEDMELGAVRWERLCARLDGDWDFLALHQRTPFSLHLPSCADRRFPPLGRGDLRQALIVASSPDGIDETVQASFDAHGVAKGIEEALGQEVRSEILVSGPDPQRRPTLNALCQRLTEGHYPILHIVCHGELIADEQGKQETILYLSDPDNKADRVRASRLIQELSRQGGIKLPYFIFLAACKSGVPSVDAALGGLAEQLVQKLGVPAVLAMRDTVSLDTVSALARQFYPQLSHHGEVDLALVNSWAGLVESYRDKRIPQPRHDLHVPALYSRLGGRPLFLITLDTVLSEADLNKGLDTVQELLKTRAPVLLGKFSEEAQRVREAWPTLPRDPVDDARAAQKERLQELNALCGEALDISFNALVQGQPVLDFAATCPFPGLKAFGLDPSTLKPFGASDQANNEHFFCGREELVQQLVGRVEGQKFLTLLGPSGSGKSSLILAGLGPELRKKCPGVKELYLTPGPNPVDRLEEKRVQLPGGPALLVVDQFEELFTLCTETDLRRKFVTVLLELRDKAWVVLSMRQDFKDDCKAYPHLFDLLNSPATAIEVRPMDQEVLRAAVEEQARRAGLRFQPGLTDKLMSEVEGEPGFMSLVQHALFELWRRRHGRWLHIDEYERIGGVRQAIARTADGYLQGKAEQEQVRVLDIFARLTRLDEDPTPGREPRDTKRRVALQTLVPAGASVETTRTVISDLASASLVVMDKEQVEVVHDSLIGHWPTLQQWLTLHRSDLRLRDEISRAAHDWKDRKQQDEESFLLHRGSRLAMVEGFLEKKPWFIINATEKDYLDTCARLREKEEERRKQELEDAKERQRQAEQIAREQRAKRKAERKARRRAQQLMIAARKARLQTQTHNKRLRWLASALTILFLAAFVLGGYAWHEKGIAEKNKQDAITQAGVAVAKKKEAEDNAKEAKKQQVLAEQASDEAQERSSRVHVTHAVEEMDHGDLPAAIPWLVDALQDDQQNGRPLARKRAATHRVRLGTLLRQCPGLIQVWPHPTAVLQAEFHPDGRRVLTVGTDEVVRLWDLTKDAPLLSLPETGPVRLRGRKYASFSPDGRRLVMADGDNAETRDKLRLAQFLRKNLFLGNLFGPSIPRQEGTARVLNLEDREWLTPPLKHERGVNSISFSPSGERFVTGGEDGTAMIWQAKGDAPGIRLLNTGHTTAHDDAVVWTTFSPDGHRVATASWDGTAQVWDTATGTPIGKRLKHQRAVRSVAFSPDGGRVVTASDDHTAQVWEAETGLSFGRALEHADIVWEARFSPDGSRVLTASGDGTARVWAVATGKPLFPSLQHEGEVYHAVFSPDGARLLTACGSRRDRDTRSRPAFFPGPLPRTYQVHVARVWDALTGEPASPPLVHFGDVQDAAFSPDGWRVITASEDHLVRVWEIAPSQSQRKQLAGSVRVGKAALSPDGRYLMTVRIRFDDSPQSSPGPSLYARRPTPDDGTRIWDLKTGKPLPIGMPHKNQVTHVAFSPDSERVVTASEDHTAQIWAVADGKPLPKPLKHEGAVVYAAFSPDGKRVVTTSVDGTAKGWDATNGHLLGKPLKHNGQVVHAAFDGTGNFVVTASGEWSRQRLRKEPAWGEARVWDIRTGNPAGPSLRHEGGVTCAMFSPNGEFVITGSQDNTAQIWRGCTGERIGAPLRHLAPVVHVAFSPDGNRVVTTSEDYTARVWDANTGASITPPLQHRMGRNDEASNFFFVPLHGYDNLIIAYPRRGVEVAAFSQDGAWVLTAGTAGDARVWDAVTGEPVTAVLPHTGSIKLATFHPDGQHVLTVTEQGSVNSWDLSPTNQSSDQLAGWGRLLALRYIDASKASVPVEPNALSGTWKQLSLLADPKALIISGEQAADWHARAADEYEASGEWFGAAWHLERLAGEKPKNLEVTARMANAYAGIGKWELAAKYFAEVRRSRPNDVVAQLQYASASLGAGRPQEYRRFCTEYFERSRKQRAPQAAAATAWLCVWIPGAVDNLPGVVKMARKAVDSEPENAFYMGALGASLFRAGQARKVAGQPDEAIRLFKEADQWLGRAIQQYSPEGAEGSESRFFLALVRHHLGHTEGAREALAAGVRAIERTDELNKQRRPAGRVSQWGNRLEVELLRREAEAALNRPGS